jgi:cytochrome c-type biogenesis protein CcmH/NrfF
MQARSALVQIDPRIVLPLLWAGPVVADVAVAAAAAVMMRRRRDGTRRRVGILAGRRDEEEGRDLGGTAAMIATKTAKM